MRKTANKLRRKPANVRHVWFSTTSAIHPSPWLRSCQLQRDRLRAADGGRVAKEG